jgi:hypothetical protein
MTDRKNSENGSEEFYRPSTPDPADQRESGNRGTADNIREQQQTHAGGAVPPAHIGSGDPDAASRPEDAIDDSGDWDQQGR